jgi:hypothetical protein
MALALAALPVAADATHKPGHTPGAGGADLTIAAAPATTVFQNATVISGRLKGPNNGGRTVALREDSHPFGTGDRQVATAVTNQQGVYSFTRRPAENTTYAVTAGLVRSERVLVNVRIRMSLGASDYTPRVGQLVRLRGRACPAHDGTTVRIQRRTSTGAFRTVRRTRLRAATRCSTYSRSLRIYRDGVYRVTADDANHATGISRARFLNAHR